MWPPVTKYNSPSVVRTAQDTAGLCLNLTTGSNSRQSKIHPEPQPGAAAGERAHQVSQQMWRRLGRPASATRGVLARSCPAWSTGARGAVAGARAGRLCSASWFPSVFVTGLGTNVRKRGHYVSLPQPSPGPGVAAAGRLQRLSWTDKAEDRPRARTVFGRAEVRPFLAAGWGSLPCLAPSLDSSSFTRTSPGRGRDCPPQGGHKPLAFQI